MRNRSQSFPKQSADNIWFPSVFSVLPWIIPAVLSIYLKYRMLSLDDMHGGFKIVARSLDRLELNSWEKFSFFRADLLLAFLMVPLGLILLARWLPKHGRFFVVLISIIASIVLYVQLRAFDQVGQFLSMNMLKTAFLWSLRDPSIISGYLNLRAFLALISVTAVLAVARHWGIKRPRGAFLHPNVAMYWIRVSVGLACLLVALTTVAWTSSLPTTPFHRSILVQVLRSLMNETEVDTHEFSDLSTAALENRYRAMTAAPEPDRDPRYWGKAKGCNVLFLVLETAPAKLMPADGELTGFPNLRSLRKTSFVGVSHYTTYPETHQAIFSIFSSWYPSSLAKGFDSQHPDLVIPGMIRRLSESGYDTALYSPYDFWGEADSEMYSSLGFQRQVYPKDSSSILKSFTSSIEIRKALDGTTLSMLKQDMERDLQQGRRFAYLFAPQISHGPWLPMKGSDGDDAAKRGLGLLKISDQWLGEIMELLQDYGQLEHSVIVIVGDHGVRAHQEDPNFAGGIFGDYSFHVPLVIYAPKAVDHMEKITRVTSHIDIAPTVLDLLGIERNKNFEQGTPIWDENLSKRTTYFFSQSLSGSDGYFSGGTFFMWSHVSDTVYESNRMNFDTVAPVPYQSSVYNDTTSSIRRMAGLEEVWASRFSQNKSVRNHFYDSASGSSGP